MDNRVHNSIVSFIWGIADDCLRDVYVRGKYRDVILPMTVIRRLDAMLEETKLEVLEMKKQLETAKIDNQWPALCNAAGQAFCNASPFLLKDLTSRSKAQTLKSDFIAYLDGFSPNVQRILEKFKFRNQIDTMVDADILGAIIEKFTSSDINLSPKPIYKDAEKKILKHPGLDNHGMGTIFEELIRKFNEENNEEAGEHWTPRDVVELMADLVFVPIADKIKDASYSCYDGACGTGGMLTVAQDRLLELAHKRNKEVAIHLFGQESQPETYAICTADMLLKGDGEEAEHIMYGSTLSNDQHASRQFDFMLSNPPYGKSWKKDAEKMGGKKEILDTRFNTYLEGGEIMPMIPRTSDGQLLFLLNNVSKMKKDTELGSRIVEVHNGSSLFTGDAGSGESNARRYLIENDLVEAIIYLPDNMFYNTGIGTYIWILSNKKEERRKGKIQLINATDMKMPLRKNMGKKNCELTAEIRAEIMRIFMEMEESKVSIIFNNEDFAYWSITVERPLRLRVYPYRDIPADKFKKASELTAVKEALMSVPAGTPTDDWVAFAKATKLKPSVLKKIRPFITEKDPTAKAVEGEADVDLRDTENVPFTYEGGIESFMQNEVFPYAPDAYIDHKKTKIGYEISFTKYFYKPVELRSMSEILSNLSALEKEADGVLSEIDNGGSEMKAYPKYVAIPLPWLSKMPAHWELARNKNIFKEVKETVGENADAYSLLSLTTKGIIPRDVESGKGKFPKDFNTYKVVKSGDMAFCLFDIDETPRTVGLSSYDGMLTGAYTIFRVNNINSQYAYYYYLSLDNVKAMRPLYSGLRKTINLGTFLATKLPIPPRDEQDQIVHFLDWQVSKINSLINAKKKQIELLEELRTKIVTDVITGKVNVSEITVPEYVFVEEAAEDLDIDLESEKYTKQED